MELKALTTSSMIMGVGMRLRPTGCEYDCVIIAPDEEALADLKKRLIPDEPLIVSRTTQVVVIGAHQLFPNPEVQDGVPKV